MKQEINSTQAQVQDQGAEQNSHCSCRVTRCPNHGKCKECVATHIKNRESVPACLKPIVDERVNKAVAAALE